MRDSFTTTEETVCFEVRQSAIHQMGLFAARPIRAGERVVEYVGQKVSKAESIRQQEAGNHYIFTLDDTFDIDGSVEWNPARFANHSCAPNCEAELDEDSIWLVALREIAPGEELTFNYGYDLEDYQDHPCRCGASNCIGYILAQELWEQVKKPNPA